MKYALENQSPNIISRESVTRPIITGNQIVDSIFPLGKGQRQLLIGDQSTGKTSFATTMIIEQKNVNKLYSTNLNGKNRTFVVYISIGNKKSEVAQIGRTLMDHNASWYTAIIFASSSETCASQYMVPFAGANLGEFIRDQGLDSLVILDDLSKHAMAFKQLSLLMKKSPSQEAYPGDIFYLHSRLLERAAQLSRFYGYGSMTMIPIVETQQENFSAYIPTNIISITDGQIYLSRELFKQGIVPATDILKSVSRIGAKAQSKILNWSSSETRNIFFNYFNVKEAMRTGQQLTDIQNIYLKRGEAAMSTWNQSEHEPRKIEIQVILNILASINKLCPKNPQSSMIFMLEKIYKNYPYIIHLISKNLYVRNMDNNLKNLILALLYKIVKKIIEN